LGLAFGSPIFSKIFTNSSFKTEYELTKPKIRPLHKKLPTTTEIARNPPSGGGFFSILFMEGYREENASNKISVYSQSNAAIYFIFFCVTDCVLTSRARVQALIRGENVTRFDEMRSIKELINRRTSTIAI